MGNRLVSSTFYDRDKLPKSGDIPEECFPIWGYSGTLLWKTTMPHFSKLFKPLLIMVIVVILIFGWQMASPADDTSFLSSRVSRLESENSVLRSRLARLESQIARLNAETGIAYTEAPTDAPIAGTPTTEGPLSSDPMFDRLATLAIELKERIVALEEQVADLQARVPPVPTT